LSFAAQVEGTLKAHFDGRDDLVLVEIDADCAGAPLRYETSRDGGLFPHLYRELRRGDVLRHQPLGSRPDKASAFPA
jgi:uncharacterized protein (DUF952 family)